MAWDPDLDKWVKCKICLIGKDILILKGLEGILKGLTFLESLQTLQDPSYYRV